MQGPLGQDGEGRAYPAARVSYRLAQRSLTRGDRDQRARANKSSLD